MIIPKIPIISNNHCDLSVDVHKNAKTLSSFLIEVKFYFKCMYMSVEGV